MRLQKPPLRGKKTSASFSFFLRCIIFFLPLVSCSRSAGGRAVPPHTFVALGTVCSVNLYEDGTEALYRRITERLQQIEGAFSVNLPSSEISAVNRMAGIAPVPVSAEVLAVLEAALAVAEKSGGAFNPAVGPLVALWGVGTETPAVPDADAIQALLPLVDYRKIQRDGAAVFLTEAGMQLDFGGIAKGYAADEAVRVAVDAGVRRALVDLGGNIYVYGKKADGTAWRVGVKNPENAGADLALQVELASGTVVTSGRYERFFEQDGIRYHHIIDPATGYPAERGVLSATVVGQSSLLADALSTAAFVLGKEKGLALLQNEYPDMDALILTADHTAAGTPRIRQTATLLRNAYGWE